MRNNFNIDLVINERQAVAQKPPELSSQPNRNTSTFREFSDKEDV